MLALSASHLSHGSPFPSRATMNPESPATNYHVLSLQHRILAIRELSDLFSTLKPSNISKPQRQTIQATLYSLTFQSYYLPDLSGFFELLYFFRGCSILRNTYLLGGQDGGTEMCFEGDGDHWEQMEGRLVDLPEISSHIIRDAEGSLGLVRDLCWCSKINREFFKILLAVVQEWKISSLTGTIPTSRLRFPNFQTLINKQHISNSSKSTSQ